MKYVVPVYDPGRIVDEPQRMLVKDVIRELVERLGRKTVAYLAGLNSVREVASWLSENGSAPRDDREAVLRSALQAVRYITDLESAESAAAWFVGTNSRFEFESPASILRERGVQGRADVVRAAREFVAEAIAAAETASTSMLANA